MGVFNNPINARILSIFTILTAIWTPFVNIAMYNDSTTIVILNVVAMVLMMIIGILFITKRKTLPYAFPAAIFGLITMGITSYHAGKQENKDDVSTTRNRMTIVLNILSGMTIMLFVVVNAYLYISILHSRRRIMSGGGIVTKHKFNPNKVRSNSLDILPGSHGVNSIIAIKRNNLLPALQTNSPKHRRMRSNSLPAISDDMFKSIRNVMKESGTTDNLEKIAEL